MTLKKFQPIDALTVLKNGTKVGELRLERQGIYFVYDRNWLATGYNLSPITMTFDDKPQLAEDIRLFDGLHGAFADSLPDGWGMLLMDRFFNGKFGDGTAYKLTALDRLSYMNDRGMGAFEYQPTSERAELLGQLNLAQLFEDSIEVQEGELSNVLDNLRLAGGSPGGARPKTIVALSPDLKYASSAFDDIPHDYSHWIVKFRALHEPKEMGAIEFAYAEMAKRAGVEMAESTLLDVKLNNGEHERFFATKRFDRVGKNKIHMMTVSALLYANYRMPSMEYMSLLKLTQYLTEDAGEVEKMARLMIFNALSHNHDDHTKNFSFLCHDSSNGQKGTWKLSPAYDLTFSNAMRGGHTTGFGGRNSGKPTRKRIKEICKDYRYLNADDYIDATLESLSNWKNIFEELDIPHQAGIGIFNVLDDIHREFN